MNANAPALDDKTVEVIREAVAEASAGRIRQACEIGERGLAAGCDAAPLHAMIGAFLVQAGEFGDSIPHLETARNARPDDPVITRNLATALVECRRYDESLAILTESAIAADKTGNLARLRGFAAQELGDFATAVKAYEKVLSDYPSDWETWNNLGNARGYLGDVEGALAALRRASELNPRALQVKLNLVLMLHVAGEVEEAESILRQMTADFPHDSLPWQYLYSLLKEQSWDDEAKDVLEGALERDPRNIGILTMLGREQVNAFEMEAATRTFRHILTLDPTSGDAFLGLVDVLERERPAELPKLLEEADAAKVDPVAAKIMRAHVALRQKRYREGADEIKELPNEAYPVRRWLLAGQLLERQGDAESAFDAFTRLNKVRSQDPTKPVVRAAALREELRERLSLITPEWRDSWAAPTIASERPSPAFLLGFPRSGTTLLDTILMGHPDVDVLEERPIFTKIGTELSAEFGGDIRGFDAISSLDEAAVGRFQERYFELASEFIDVREDALLIDKSPLHSQNLPLIYRLFPDARIILALRHPADVVLSCFMANFRLNSAMANFLQLDTAAEFYDITFSTWEKSRALLPVEVLTVVYEQLIADPEAELRPVVEGLGLTWRQDMLDHQRTAEARGVIRTASYAQVTEPLYRGAAGRWKRYRKHLEPVLPTLAPWIEKFGYEL